MGEAGTDDYEIMECIDDGLNTLGPSVKYTVYWRLTILHNVPRGGILVNPDAFVNVLRSIFGAGARRIESTIVNEIAERSGQQVSELESLPEVIRRTRREAELLNDTDGTNILLHPAMSLAVNNAVQVKSVGRSKGRMG